jgi:hypothetical protein
MSYVVLMQRLWPAQQIPAKVVHELRYRLVVDIDAAELLAVGILQGGERAPLVDRHALVVCSQWLCRCHYA